MTAREAYHLAINGKGRPEPRQEVEDAIRTDVVYTYYYAKNVIGGRWRSGEAIIATNLGYSFHYAMYVVETRWELGEEIISGNPDMCKAYIRMVLKSDEKYETDPDFMAFVLAHGQI